MDRTIAICTSHRGASDETLASLKALQTLGATVRIWSGLADVALARNVYLTRALREVSGTATDVMLLVDDDMQVPADVAQQLVSRARATGRGISACYATNSGHLAATRCNGGWLTGLGALAVTVDRVAALAQKSALCRTVNGETAYAFTWTGPEHQDDAEPIWFSEDYRFCERLNGVLLEPVAVGHLKRIALYPDEETIARLTHEEEAREA
jgi:hypothetical protein